MLLASKGGRAGNKESPRVMSGSKLLECGEVLTVTVSNGFATRSCTKPSDNNSSSNASGAPAATAMRCTTAALRLPSTKKRTVRCRWLKRRARVVISDMPSAVLNKMDSGFTVRIVQPKSTSRAGAGFVKGRESVDLRLRLRSSRCRGFSRCD